MSKPDIGSDIQRMTAYCTYCPKMCRFTCPASSAEGRETVTPWGMMRLFELAADGSVPLDDDVAETFFHCTGCRRCQTFCAHDNDVPRALWQARRWAVKSGFLPQAYHDLYERFQESNTPYGESAFEIDESPFAAGATIGYWPDCSTVEHRPHIIAPIGRLLSQITGQKVRLVRSADFDRPPCCGFPLTAAGIEDTESCRHERWPALNELEQVWTDCPALAAWNHSDSSWSANARPEDPEIGHIFTLLAEELPNIGDPENPLDADDALLHQSCYVARQLDALDSVAEILAHICKSTPQQMAYSDEESPCCGGRCHYRVLEPEASGEAAKRVVESLDRNDDARRMVTTSSMCRHAMNSATDDELVTSILELVCLAYEC